SRRPLTTRYTSDAVRFTVSPSLSVITRRGTAAAIEPNDTLDGTVGSHGATVGSKCAIPGMVMLEPAPIGGMRHATCAGAVCDACMPACDCEMVSVLSPGVPLSTAPGAEGCTRSRCASNRALGDVARNTMRPARARA